MDLCQCMTNERALNLNLPMVEQINFDFMADLEY